LSACPEVFTAHGERDPPGEASLLSEVATAFGAPNEKINDMVPKLMRLYRLRQNLA